MVKASAMMKRDRAIRKPYRDDKRNAHVYSILAESAYKNSNQRADFVKEEGLRGYKYLASKSSPEIAVFHNKGSKRYILAFRGTELNKDVLTAIKDLASDASIVLGYGPLQERIDAGSKLIYDLEDKESEFILTGHSLGGTIAAEIASEFRIGDNVQAHVFNMGASPLEFVYKDPTEILKRGMGHYFKDLGDIVHYHSRGDIISQSALLEGHEHVIFPSQENPHSLKNFRGEFPKPKTLSRSRREHAGGEGLPAPRAKKARIMGNETEETSVNAVAL